MLPQVMLPGAPPVAAGPPAVGIVITLGELVQAEEALQRLIEVKMPAKTAYHVAKLMRLVTAETQHYHKQREEAIRELGMVNPDNPNEIRVLPERMLEFTKRLNELHVVETRIDWLPLSVNDLPEITASDLLRLGSLIT
jgi:hypothetical protein